MQRASSYCRYTVPVMSLVLARVVASATLRVGVDIRFSFSFEISSRRIYCSSMSPSCVLKVCFGDLDFSSGKEPVSR